MNLLFLSVALADPPPAAGPWWAGLETTGVNFQGEGLPEESLEPLLRVAPGRPLTAADLRDDITTLYRVGRFAAVEADVSPWTTPDGELGAAVEYWVYAAPRVSRVQVQGAPGPRARALLDVAGIEPGDVFLDAIDAPPAIDAMRAWYRDQGFPDAAIEVESDALGQGETDVWIRVQEGVALTVREVRFIGDLPVPHPRMVRWLAAHGVRKGRPAVLDAVEGAANALETDLAVLGGGPFAPRRGWLEARVTRAPPIVDTEGNVYTVVAIPDEKGVNYTSDRAVVIAPPLAPQTVKAINGGGGASAGEVQFLVSPVVPASVEVLTIRQ